MSTSEGSEVNSSEILSKDILEAMMDLVGLSSLKSQLSLEKVISFRRVLSRESDRGCALFAAAYLDQELSELLKSFFVDDEKVFNDISKGTNALSAFSSRIDICYLLGLIGPLARKDFHLVRKIRNDFAHVASDISFDTESIAQRCREFYSLSPERHSDPDPKGKFIGVCHGLLAIIHGEKLLATKISKREDLNKESANKAYEHMQEIRDTLFTIIMSEKESEKGEEQTSSSIE
jgi:hypothetical protein